MKLTNWMESFQTRIRTVKYNFIIEKFIESLLVRALGMQDSIELNPGYSVETNLGSFLFPRINAE